MCFKGAQCNKTGKQPNTKFRLCIISDPGRFLECHGSGTDIDRLAGPQSGKPILTDGKPPEKN